MNLHSPTKIISELLSEMLISQQWNIANQKAPTGRNTECIWKETQKNVKSEINTLTDIEQGASEPMSFKLLGSH